MCGIAGIVGSNVSEQSLTAMAGAMRHRGPDDQGTYRAAGVGLAFRRLSIVDLAGGRQPMANEDGQVRVVFNGEIYDHAGLRKQLEHKGHHFATDHSDTEVLVHGWEEWGADLFPRLNGMFGVAVWDQATRTLVLARDRYGIKPVYYAPLPDGGLLFASEVRAILASGRVPCAPLDEGVMEYFSFQTLSRAATMFRGVYQLEPATLLLWRDGRFTLRRYWDLAFPRSRRDSPEELTARHRDILQRAIRRQLAADVPVKTYLSGGIDSTALTVVSYQIDPSVTAYSCIFDLENVGEDRTSDEREFSRLVAREYGLERVEVELRPEDLERCLADYVRSLEDLRMGMGYPVYYMARRVAEDAKVVLSGTGGDEFHAGYVSRYAAVCPGGPRTLRQRLGGLKRRLLGQSPAGPEAVYRRLLNFVFRPGEAGDAFTPEFRRGANGFDADEVMTDFLGRCPSADWRDRVMYVDAKMYLSGLLAFEDKVSMAHALETRVPLLDNELVDFLLDVPFDALWQGQVGKVLFRESVRPWVPEAVYRKPKMGFGPPDASWYRGRLRPWIENLLAPQVRGERGVLQGRRVRSILDGHFSGRANSYYLIWSLINFEMWCRVFGFYGAASAGTALGA